MTDKRVSVALLNSTKADVLVSLLKKNGIEAIVDKAPQSLSLDLYNVVVPEEFARKALSIVSDALTINVDAAIRRKTVLVPVDFSIHSNIACEYGILFAHKNGLAVTILHTYITESYTETLPPGIKILSDKIKRDKEVLSKKDKAKAAMDAFKEKLEAKVMLGELPEVPVSYQILEGIPEVEIVEYSRQTKPALIIMGTRGKHQKEADLIGSVTAEVMDTAEFPLLIIPDGLHPADLISTKNVMCYCNLDKSDILTLDDYVSKLDTNHVGEVFLTHIKGKREKFVEERIDAFCRYCGQQFTGVKFRYHILEDETFMDDFNDYLKKNSIKLLVLPNRKRNIFRRLFNPSFAHRVFFHTDIAMAVLPTVEEKVNS